MIIGEIGTIGVIPGIGIGTVTEVEIKIDPTIGQVRLLPAVNDPGAHEGLVRDQDHEVRRVGEFVPLRGTTSRYPKYH